MAAEKVTLGALQQSVDGPDWSAACNTLEQIRAAVEASEADCLLVDRILNVAGPVAESVDLPFVTIGSPGGAWARSPDGVRPGPPSSESDLSGRLAADIDWFDATLDSEWLVSPTLNVSFLGRLFYPSEVIDSKSALVDLHSSRRASFRLRSGRLGFAFGHTGLLSDLRDVLDRVVEEGQIPPDAIDLLIGGRPDDTDEFLRYRMLGMRVHDRWTDYRRAFADLSAVVTFGGIGTLWHAIDRYVVSLVVPGRAGDQVFNGKAIGRCGLGLRYTAADPLPLPSLLDWEDRSAAFDRFRDTANFTDDLVSVCERLEGV